MNTVLRHFGYLDALALMLVGITCFAFSLVPTVNFEKTPLFLDANIEPGDSEARTITVTNAGTGSEELYLSSANDFSTGLGEVMSLAVTAPGSAYFTGVFDNFFTITPLSLGSIAGGETKVFTLSAALPSGAGNAYQTKQLGFDLLIGFVGGGSVTDNPNGGSNDGGGGGGKTNILKIFNELVESVDGRTATLTWNTNLNASTYLVCGVVTDVKFTLTDVAPLFGYQFVLPEQDTNTKVHKAILNGLEIGKYECRPAGRVSPSNPFTVGEALQFEISPDGQVLGAATSLPLISGFKVQPRGSVLGAYDGKADGPTYDEWKAEMEAEKAAKAFSSATVASSSVLDDSLDNEGSEGDGEDSEKIPISASNIWYWLIFIIILILGVWYRSSATRR
jgi:hypothetical protein